ncbi:MAG: WD40/YVTN/BNR-like repeat-containing protein [Panacagrimonas sp.]
MNIPTCHTRTALVLAGLLLAGATAIAQDPGGVAPEASEMATKAASSLLLDVVNTGEQLIAVGERGNLLRSADGRGWAQVVTPVRSTLTAVVFVDAQHGWAVGHDASIIHTVDGARTWSVQHFQPQLNQPLLDVLFLDAQHGFAVGTFGLFLQTLDGGKTWLDVDAPAIKEEGSHLNAMVRLKNGQLLVVGERGFIALSADGLGWDRLASPYEGSFFGAVPVGESGAVIFGLRGNALISDDVRAGQWKPVQLGSTRSAFGGTALPDGRVVLVGADGLSLIVSADGSVSEAGHRSVAGSTGGGTLNSVVSWEGALIAVGELGVQVRDGGG